MKLLMVCLLVSWPIVAWAQDSPDYPHGDFEDDCTLCHRSESWAPAVISRDFKHTSRMPLTGAHAQTECRACHVSLEFNRADPACVSCHLDVHESELGIDCAQCHSKRSFIDRTKMIQAHLATRFPLRGAHRAVDCEECHRPAGAGSLQYVKTPPECVACHLDSYLATATPDHQASGFPQTCESCHSTHAWIPAGFNHNTLTAGAQCVDCHLDNYNATTNPDHQANGLLQTCDVCHSTQSWVPAGYREHDTQFFPIYSGAHRGRWTTCDECHVVPADFSQFSCVDCHQHDDPVRVANQHDEVSGYQYDSQACYTCHPRGSH